MPIRAHVSPLTPISEASFAYQTAQSFFAPCRVKTSAPNSNALQSTQGGKWYGQAMRSP